MKLYVLYVCLYAKSNTYSYLTGISWANWNGTRDNSGGGSEVWYSNIMAMVARFGVDVCEIYVYRIYIYIYSSHYSGVIWGSRRLNSSTADSLCNNLFTLTLRKINAMPPLTGPFLKESIVVYIFSYTWIVHELCSSCYWNPQNTIVYLLMINKTSCNIRKRKPLYINKCFGKLLPCILQSMSMP